MKSPNTPSATLWTKEFCMLLFVNLFSGMAGQMTIPIVTKYAMHLGATLELASTIASLMSFAGLLLCPFAGAVADRVNRKWLFVIANVIYGVSILLHSVITGPTGLIIIRLLTGISFAFTSVTLIAYTSTFVPRERYGEGMGYIALATILAQAAGPGLGLSLLDSVGYGVTFILAGTFALLSVIVVLIIPYKELNKKTEKYRFSFRDLIEPRLLVFTLLAALFSIANGLVSTFLALIADERSIGNIGLFFTVYSAFMIFIRPFSGKLLDKKGIYIILYPAFLLAAIGLVTVGYGQILPVMLLGSVLKAFGQGSGTPSIQAHCVKVMGREKAGVATSTCQIGQHIGNTLAPWLGGKFVSSIGYTSTFVGYGAVLLVLGWIALIFQQKVLDKKASA